VLVAIGVNVICNRKYLPRHGPAIMVANHNSHLDTLVLMTLLPMQMLNRIQPVAAADYFLNNRILAWFAVNIIGILPIVRNFVPGKTDPLMPACRALTSGRVLIIFPEGSRGEPEHMADFKNGIAHLARRYPQVPVVPVFLYGPGRILPRGKFLPVPFFCDVFVGKPLYGESNIGVFMRKLRSSFETLSHQQQFSARD